MWPSKTIRVVRFEIWPPRHRLATKKPKWRYPKRNMSILVCTSLFLKLLKEMVEAIYIYIYIGVSKNNGTPKSSTFLGFSIINHPFGVPLFLETPISQGFSCSCGFVAWHQLSFATLLPDIYAIFPHYLSYDMHWICEYFWISSTLGA